MGKCKSSDNPNWVLDFEFGRLVTKGYAIHKNSDNSATLFTDDNAGNGNAIDNFYNIFDAMKYAEDLQNRVVIQEYKRWRVVVRGKISGDFNSYDRAKHHLDSLDLDDNGFSASGN